MPKTKCPPRTARLADRSSPQVDPCVQRMCPPPDTFLSGMCALDAVSRHCLDTAFFYGRALTDELLAEPFTELREAGLESHLPVMCDFWETVLFGTKSYRRPRRPPPPARAASAHGRSLPALAGAVDRDRRATAFGPFPARAVLQAGWMARAMNRRITGDRSWGSGEPVLTPVRTRDRPASDRARQPPGHDPWRRRDVRVLSRADTLGQSSTDISTARRDRSHDRHRYRIRSSERRRGWPPCPLTAPP